ncbi:hypothetical protein BX600DRAFT_462613 [Xylariales sp. PMI_506]|nr:hypothetical protein BX600DRAFT_462613 [Xylariales sp. PMI_506]
MLMGLANIAIVICKLGPKGAKTGGCSQTRAKIVWLRGASPLSKDSAGPLLKRTRENTAAAALICMRARVRERVCVCVCAHCAFWRGRRLSYSGDERVLEQQAAEENGRKGEEKKRCPGGRKSKKEKLSIRYQVPWDTTVLYMLQLATASELTQKTTPSGSLLTT